MPRQAHRWEVDLSDEERTALAAVEDYVRNGYAPGRPTRRTHAIGFVMVIFQKLMASSIRALRMSLDRRRERLDRSAAAPVRGRRRPTQDSDGDETSTRRAHRDLVATAPRRPPSSTLVATCSTR